MPPGAGRAYNRRGVAHDVGPQFFFPDALLAVWRFYDPRCSLVYTDAAGERLADADCEAPTASAWTAGNGAALSKETSDPYEGLRCLRITKAGDWGSALQSVLQIGSPYWCSGRYRTDGTAAFRVSVGGSVVDFPAASDWTLFTVSAAAATALCEFYKWGAAGTWAEVDALQLVERPQLATVPNLPYLQQLNQARYGDPFDLNQSTPANRPLLGPGGWPFQMLAGEFNGSSSWMQADQLGALLTGTDVPWGALASVQHDATASYRSLVMAGNSGSSTQDEILRLNTANTLLTHRRSDAGAVGSLTSAQALSAGRYVLGHDFDGVNDRQYINGALDANSPANTQSGAATYDQFTVGAVRSTAVSQWFLGSIRELWLLGAPVHAEQMIAASKFLAAVDPLG